MRTSLLLAATLAIAGCSNKTVVEIDDASQLTYISTPIRGGVMVSFEGGEVRDFNEEELEWVALIKDYLTAQGYNVKPVLTRIVYSKQIEGPNVNGVYIPQTDLIVINIKTEGLTTLPHEILHIHQYNGTGLSRDNNGHPDHVFGWKNSYLVDIFKESK